MSIDKRQTRPNQTRPNHIASIGNFPFSFSFFLCLSLLSARINLAFAYSVLLRYNDQFLNGSWLNCHSFNYCIMKNGPNYPLDERNQKK